MQKCPSCGGSFLLAPPDPTVPTYPTCSAVRPVTEYICQGCHLSYTATPRGYERTATILADVLSRFVPAHMPVEDRR